MIAPPSSITLANERTAGSQSNRCRAKLSEINEREQRKLESAGEWDAANILNVWLMGAFASEEDLLQDKMPIMRVDFLERMISAQNCCA